ncbi:protein I'm not dead yet-like [Epargyreus clarus]|uniref:protein I'm not dead yet-like n=1 Tax=Epargyreus clarus TaxID=520877 RepID=UPI003C2C6F74
MEPAEKAKLFLVVHWRGVISIVTPLLAIGILLPLPAEDYEWCAYCLIVMAVFWVSECIPLAITSFIPVIVFPLTGVLNTSETCKAYINDTMLMFIGSLILAYAVEQSGLHKRLAYSTIRAIGYSHVKLLLAVCVATTFISMWITNTAATTMMVPINFAILGVFEQQKMMKIYEYDSSGEKIASDITTCYFCSVTYSATIGGTATLVGTATNLAFKGLFMSTFPTAPEYLSFPKFSMFAIPCVILIELCMFAYMLVLFLGVLRPDSEAAKNAKLTKAGIAAAKQAVDEDFKKLGPITYWEWMVIILFGGAMIMFFCRSPQLFPGWGDKIEEYFEKEHRFILDSSLAFLVGYLMLLLPANLSFFQNCTAKYGEDLTKQRVRSVLDWKTMITTMPYSFTFLLGGGFALSVAAKKTGLNEKIGAVLQKAESLPDIVVLLVIIIVVIIFTNFASNVAVCNVFAPIVMQLAKETGRNPLLYTLAAGVSASFTFLLPVGTPGNVIVQSAASIPTRKMIIAGIGPTITTAIIVWLGIYFWSPIIWPDIHEKPEWSAIMI